MKEQSANMTNLPFVLSSFVAHMSHLQIKLYMVQTTKIDNAKGIQNGLNIKCIFINYFSSTPPSPFLPNSPAPSTGGR